MVARKNLDNCKNYSVVSEKCLVTQYKILVFDISLKSGVRGSEGQDKFRIKSWNLNRGLTGKYGNKVSEEQRIERDRSTSAIYKYMVNYKRGKAKEELQETKWGKYHGKETGNIIQKF